jgi:hypothetical protein
LDRLERLTFFWLIERIGLQAFLAEALDFQSTKSKRLNPSEEAFEYRFFSHFHSIKKKVKNFA